MNNEEKEELQSIALELIARGYILCLKDEKELDKPKITKEFLDECRRVSEMYRKEPAYLLLKVDIWNKGCYWFSCANIEELKKMMRI